jgi:hypothetical protein
VPARVDDDDDVVDRHGRLRDVRRQHDLADPAGGANKGPALVLRGDHGVQGQDQVTGLPRPVTLTTGEIVEAL